MPHKRKRKSQDGKDNASLDSSKELGHQKKSRRTDRKDAIKKSRDDGISRSLQRVLASAKGFRPPSGLDEGDGATGSKRGSKQAGRQPISTPTVPKIAPGERLADYAARVDAALPLPKSGRGRKGLAISGLKQPQTRTERKMHRVQSQWRLEDAKYQAKKEEALEELEEEMEEQMPGVSVKHFMSGKKDALDDPWAVVAANRVSKERKKGLVGVHDVVSEPPRLKPIRPMLRGARSFTDKS